MKTLLQSINFAKGGIHQSVFDSLDELSVLTMQPDLPKKSLGTFNYWDKRNRKDLGDCAKTAKLVLDFDGVNKKDFFGNPIEGEYQSMEEVLTRFEKYEYIAYNTASSTKEKNKFRVILSLAKPIFSFWLRLAKKEKTFREFFRDNDFSSFDTSHVFFQPSKYDGDHAPVALVFHDGELLDLEYEFGDERQLKYNISEQREEYAQPNISRPENRSIGGEIPKRRTERQMSLSETEKRVVLHRKWFTEYMDKLEGLHYCDVPKVVAKAVGLEIDYYFARIQFEQKYVGNSNWKPYWENRWRLSEKNQ